MLRYLPLLFLPLLAQVSIPRWNVRGVGNTASRPAACTANRDAYVNTQTSTINYCTATNTWTELGTGSGSGVTTGVTLTADLPAIGAGGSAVAVGTRSGNTTQYVTTTGAQTSGDCVKIDANGNHVANGSACGGGGSGGLTLIEQHAASSSATLDFTTCISSTYDEYMVELINVKPATDNTDLYFRMSTDGGSTYDTSSIYGSVIWRMRAAASSVTGAEGSAAQIQITSLGVDSSASWAGVSGWLKLYNPGSSFYKQISGSTMYFGDSDQYRSFNTISGTYESTTAANAFRFLFSSGNIASGTIRCYGLAK